MSEPHVSPVPLHVTFTSTGFMPDVGLHCRNGKVIQESSYSMWLGALTMFILAVISCFIPWEQRAFLGNGPKVIYFIAAGFAWGGICVVAMIVGRNLMGQRVVIDLDAETISIDHSDFSAIIPWSRIVGVQVCGGGESAYQANLVFWTQSGEMMRHCLLSHAIRGYCISLAKQYCNHCRLELINH